MRKLFGGEEYENCESIESKLKSIYDKTEEKHNGRDKNYKKELGRIEDIRKSKTTTIFDEATEKLYCMVAANLSLRVGQSKAESFDDAKNDYQNAIKWLRKYTDEKNDTSNEINCIIQLCIAKYFRNMGHCDRRSNFAFAKHELKKLEGWLNRLENWNEIHSQIWLDTKINIGRNYKNSYKFEEAKEYFWKMFLCLKGKLNLNVENHKKLSEMKKPDDIMISENDIEDKDIYNRLVVEDSIIYEYGIQIFVQLAIVYRKTRDYDCAIKICEEVLEIENENIDIKNNLGVCLRKKGDYEGAVEQVKKIKDSGNRFATINYWKCMIDTVEDIKNLDEKNNEEFDQFIEENKKDYECRLLLGRIHLREKRLDEAYRVFEELYNDFPHLNRGSIALKAYYSMAKCLMAQDKYTQALHILKEILSACENDVLAQLDKGWCLMRLGNYEEAKAHYERMAGINKETVLLNVELSKEYNDYDKIRFWNNLGECYLKTRDVERADTAFSKVEKKENNNIAVMKFHSRQYFLEGEREEEKGNRSEAYKKYQKVIKILEPIECRDSQIESRIVRAYTKIFKLYKEQNEEFDRYKNFLEKRLLYYPEVRYSQKACADMADFFEEKERLNAKELQYMYRAFSRIQLSERAEGYKAFNEFMNSSEFKRLSAEERGKVLSILFPIYREIISVKKICRYTPQEGERYIPVHYTKLDTLTKLLAEAKEGRKPYLRLWNSANMNDPHEGTCFWEMMKIVTNIKDGEKMETLYKYFPMFVPDSQKHKYKDVRGNIYITSFSKKKDDLLMWIAYGDNAKGCNIEFSDEFIDIRCSANEMMDVSLYSDKDIPLYQVQYIDRKGLEENTIRILNSELEDITERMEKSILKIWEYIQKLEKIMDNFDKSRTEENEQKNKEKREFNSKNESKEAIVSFVIDALNEVRYLFKDDEYQHEDEMRVVEYSAEPEYDYNFEIPRPYMNLKRDIQIEEVKLGAKIEPLKKEEIETWLVSTGKVKKISKSEKHYK